MTHKNMFFLCACLIYKASTIKALRINIAMEMSVSVMCSWCVLMETRLLLFFIDSAFKG